MQKNSEIFCEIARGGAVTRCETSNVEGGIEQKHRLHLHKLVLLLTKTQKTLNCTAMLYEQSF